MTLLVTSVATPAEFQQAKDIRLRVFHEEQGFDPVLEFDEHDNEPSTIHFLGKDIEQDKYVAVGRVLMDETTRSAKIGRVAVLQECRGKSYGVALMEGMERLVKAFGTARQEGIL
ncbi:Acetyltransferase (GNAT) family [Phytophthora infestans]|uniref:Acetyltransferase (GNAT) family n=1 Tax=Phytophthora infestans TaxID=4787 RepID=A0A833S9Z3_PHYIN|nr:Acetyltransferase (GNAT) family [Phytophthora infestans]KAF4141801.1 Acetyltransferase (GNAT) family [Phytophthora infestans]